MSGPGEIFPLEIQIYSLLDGLFLTGTVTGSGSSGSRITHCDDDVISVFDLKLSSFQRPKRQSANYNQREENYIVKRKRVQAFSNNRCSKTVSVKNYCKTPSYCGVTFSNAKNKFGRQHACQVQGRMAQLPTVGDCKTI